MCEADRGCELERSSFYHSNSEGTSQGGGGGRESIIITFTFHLDLQTRTNLLTERLKIFFLFLHSELMHFNVGCLF